MAPSGLPSPPDTHSSYFAPLPASAHQRPMATPGSSLDLSLPLSMDTPTSRFRRGPSIGYHTTGLRDSRERNGSMGSKFLVIIVPPSSVAQEHGNLGHTLSTGPAHRLSQGLIMPLFPTMYGQLTAIAREFSFPSSAGICLYYCYSDHGVTMTPRLSDDVWATVWGFNDPSEKRSPIVGKIEFDIDMVQARWYGAWISSRHRESTENAIYQGPTTAPSLQFRGDNRFTFPRNSSEDGSETPQQHSAPVVTRHMPRKLSLVDRFDTQHVVQTEIRPSRSSASPPTGLPLSSHILSPITQQEEPKSARLTLTERVKSWRQSAVVNSPIDLESNAAEIVDVESAEQSPGSQSSFHIEDYAFSISSVGPGDDTSIGSYHQDYLPSVHLCDRINGSVCLTASYCTSAGPSSEFEYSFEPFDDVRVPSPDIAWRMFEEAPPTPRTATSWGPPSPGSFVLSIDDYTPSLDIAHRAFFSRPSTPGTATSWGPQSFDEAYSIASPRSAFSIHLCDRGEYSRPPTPQTATSWGPASCDFSVASPFRLPSPDAAHRAFEDADEWDMRASMLDAWRRALADDVDRPEWLDTDEEVTEEPSPPAQPWGHSWPYRQPTKVTGSEDESRSGDAGTSGATVDAQEQTGSAVAPWAHSWPYRKAGVSLKTVAMAVSGFSAVPTIRKVPQGKKGSSSSQADPSHSGYPFFVLYPPVYPHFELYPSAAGTSSQGHNKPRPSPVELSSNSGYPRFVLYPSVYPHFDLYPTVKFGVAEDGSHSAGAGANVDVQEQTGSTVALWAHSWPYRKAGVSLKTVAMAVSAFSSTPTLRKVPQGDKGLSLPSQATPSHSGYPFFVLYSPVYPHFELYPPAAGTFSRSDIKPRLSPVELTNNSGYPCFVLYPSVYPYFDLYPPVKFGVKETSASQSKPSPISVLPNASYPSLVIYPPVYPYFALYPPVKDETPVVAPAAPTAGFWAGYPTFVLYPAGYPHNLTEIYPGVALSDSRTSRSTQVSTPVVENPHAVFAGYPFFCIYSPSYPHSVSKIYPAVLKAREQSKASVKLPQPCRIEPNTYPSLIIYPSVYPHNLEMIYPPLKAAKPLRRTESAQRSRAAYPYFDLYPAVYPHFNLYPSVTPAPLSNNTRTTVSASSLYPSLVIYPSQYPHFDLYPPPAASCEPLKVGKLATISVKVVPRYPHFDLYPAVYPHFRLWPVSEPAPTLRPTPVVATMRPLIAMPAKRLTPPPQRAPTSSLPLVPSALASKRASPPPQPAPAFGLPPVPLVPPVKRVKSVRILDRPRRTRSSRLTHSELHAMVMMERRGLALDMQLDDLDESEEISETLPAFLRLTEPSSTTSDAGPVRVFPRPTASLSRSSTLPLRRPRPTPGDSVDASARGSIYAVESVRARGLRFNTMSATNLEQKSPGLARRMSLWEKGNTVASNPGSPTTTPTTRTPAKLSASRDSLVGQRIRTFSSQTAS